MLSYRHAFHAGNLADVFKHLMLQQLLLALTRKEAPFCYLETHAGGGPCDLEGPLARQRREYQHGIDHLVDRDRLAAAPPHLADLLTYLARERAAGRYPGSVEVARRMLRANDRMALAELHPREYAALSAGLANRPRTVVRHEDGYALLKALMPPPERRALVLLDPAYELNREGAALTAALSDGLRRFRQGVYMVWYPLRGKLDASVLARRLWALQPDKKLKVELTLTGAREEPGLLPSGVIVLNPPYRVDRQTRQMMAWLCAAIPDSDYRLEIA